MQMVEAPTDYAMSRCFMDALKPEIASGMVMCGLTPEKSVFNEIVQKAIDMEEALFYRNKDDCYKSKTASSLGKQSVVKPYRAKEGTTKAPLKTLGSHKNLSSTTQKDVECYFCKQKGHISPNCPKKTRRAMHIRKTMSESEDRAEEVSSEGEHAFAVEHKDSGHNETVC